MTLGRSIALGLPLLVAAQAAIAAPAGHYRLAGEQDVASELMLGEDGRFRYFLIAGALDEMAEGKWTVEGHTVRLATEPEPVPPSFSAGASSLSAGEPFNLKVTWPDGRGIAGVDFRLGFDSGEPIVSYTQEDGWILPDEEKRAPRWIELAVPMHGLISPRFPIDAGKANRLAFVLTPNDLGRVNFKDVPIEMDGDKIVMHRFGQKLLYEPAK